MRHAGEGADDQKPINNPSLGVSMRKASEVLCPMLTPRYIEIGHGRRNNWSAIDAAIAGSR